MASITPSPTPTNTVTPSITPTNTPTPTKTPTNTPTPTKTPLVCTSGITEFNYGYYDCCGNYQSGQLKGQYVAFDRTRPYFGMVPLDIPVIVPCGSPTPTPSVTPTRTPAVSPSVTPSPTVTPSLSPSPTVTPTVSGLIQPENDCKVITLFDMGVNCEILQMPSSSTATNGIIKVNVTGGTSPYSFFWSNGTSNQILSNVGYGSYQCTVVDFYGDYTATTICTIARTTPTPTPTVTVTPSLTPGPTLPNICVEIITDGPNGTVYLQNFTPSGTQNGKYRWVSTSGWIMFWNNLTNRWEIQGYTGGGLPVSYTTAQIPLSSWTIVGAPSTYTTSVTQGSCPVIPQLFTTVTVTNASCQGSSGTACNGGLTVAVRGGVPPYSYILGNNLTWGTSNIFNGLCPGQYSVVVRDARGALDSRTVTVGAGGAPTTYSLGFEILSEQTINPSNKVLSWRLFSQPQLPQGVSVNLNIGWNVTQNILGPFYNNNPDATFQITNTNSIFVDGTTYTPTRSTPQSSLIPRPNCSPSESKTTSFSDSYSVVLTRDSIITGTTTSTINNLNFAALNGCVAEGQQNIRLNISSIRFNCSCCDVVAGGSNPLVNHNLEAQATNSFTSLKWQIMPSVNIKNDGNLAVAGVVCTSTNVVSCTKNIRFTDAAPQYVLTNNGQEFTRNYSVPNTYSNFPILMFIANFQATQNGNQSVQVIVYKNGVPIGSATNSGYFAVGSFYNVQVPLNLPMNLDEPGAIYKILYTGN